MRACRKRWIGCGVSVFAAILVGLVGCGRDGEKAGPNETPQPAVQAVGKQDNKGKPIPALSVALEKLPKLLPFADALLHEPPSDSERRPPDVTHTGKNAVKIYETIANEMWDKITFTNREGRRIRYHAIVATDLGDIHLDLHGSLAPNHVRSFVCLAKTGYYDGMTFYHSINRKVEDNTVAYIEAGCPRGTGEAGSGSIGYWQAPRIPSSCVSFSLNSGRSQ